MELTLVSLASARYEPGVHIDLSITLQQPEVDSDANSAAYLKVQRLIEQLEWKQGTKTLIVLDRFVGVTDRWIDKWRLRPNNDAFLLVLQAGQILSPYWMTWTAQALNQYYFDPVSSSATATSVHTGACVPRACFLLYCVDAHCAFFLMCICSVHVRSATDGHLTGAPAEHRR